MPGEGYAKGRERRNEILRAAMDLFGAHGYRKTTIAQVAEQAGITDAGLLHHFPSKAHLLVAVLEYRDERAIELLQHALRNSETPIQVLIELCRRNAADPNIVRLFTVIAAESIDEDHPGHAAFVTRYRDRRRDTAELMADAQRAGLIDADVDVHRLAAQVLAMYDGLQMQWLRDPGEVDMVALFEDFLGRFRPAS